jgi:hypothetical protein
MHAVGGYHHRDKIQSGALHGIYIEACVVPKSATTHPPAMYSVTRAGGRTIPGMTPARDAASVEKLTASIWRSMPSLCDQAW